MIEARSVRYAIEEMTERQLLRTCGTATTAGTGLQGAIDLRFVDNTIVGCDTGLWLDDEGSSTTALYANNIFTGATVAAVKRYGAGTATHGHNALFGNVTNYSGAAADGAGYVKTDCLLGTTGPVPALGQGSPCLGAADSTVAAALDFFSVPRGPTPDIGAVERP